MKKTFRFRTRRVTDRIPLPSFPRRREATEEPLTGMVGDLQASAPEERLAKALDKAKIPYRFRMTVGAPRGLPGWKELDFVASVNGIIYPIEVDTVFTHREKQNADVLHDAIILNDQYIQQLGTVYPQVTHVDGDSNLADNASAEMYVKQRFGA